VLVLPPPTGPPQQLKAPLSPPSSLTKKKGAGDGIGGVSLSRGESSRAASACHQLRKSSSAHTLKVPTSLSSTSSTPSSSTANWSQKPPLSPGRSLGRGGSAGRRPNAPASPSLSSPRHKPQSPRSKSTEAPKPKTPKGGQTKKNEFRSKVPSE
jgi:hypothetical protein